MEVVRVRQNFSNLEKDLKKISGTALFLKKNNFSMNPFYKPDPLNLLQGSDRLNPPYSNYSLHKRFKDLNDPFGRS